MSHRRRSQRAIFSGPQAARSIRLSLGEAASAPFFRPAEGRASLEGHLHPPSAPARRFRASETASPRGPDPASTHPVAAVHVVGLHHDVIRVRARQERRQPPISSGRAMRPNGTSAPTRRFFSLNGGFSQRAKRASTSSQCSLSTTPGAMAFTLVPCRIRFSPALWVMEMTAALDAQYAATSGSPRRPACGAKLIDLAGPGAAESSSSPPLAAWTAALPRSPRRPGDGSRA